MQCEEFDDRLNRLLDHRLAPGEDELLAAHARDCEACAELLLAQERLFSGLKQRSLRPSVDLAERVVAQQYLEVSGRKRAWRNAGWGLLLATAASLGGLALMSLRPGESPPNIVLQQPVHSPHAGSALAIGGIGTNAGKMANEAAPDEKLGEYFVALENLATQISDSKEFDEVSESLEPGFRPIRSPFGLAIDALRRTLPRSKENRGTKPDAGASWLPDLPAIS